MIYKITINDFGKSMLEALEKLEAECYIKLSKYQKLILSEVATVEQTLSIIVGTPITIELVKQEETHHQQQQQQQQQQQRSSRSTTPIMRREVWLKDAEGNRLIHAISKYQPRNLPGNIAADMGKGLIGIGTSIAKHELPTYRKVIEIGYNRDSNTLHREYCIISKQRTLFVIFEEFDANLFT
ncbi:MAG: DUF98 domain-containing protein [Thaumarchaeota archaeon]|nr:DUF98 domain-containing protein [Nitrososphaerota archaeon]